MVVHPDRAGQHQVADEHAIDARLRFGARIGDLSGEDVVYRHRQHSFWRDRIRRPYPSPGRPVQPVAEQARLARVRSCGGMPLTVTIERPSEADRGAWRHLFNLYAEFYRMPMDDGIAGRVWSWI